MQEDITPGSHAPEDHMTDEEKIDGAAARILERYAAAFEELAK